MLFDSHFNQGLKVDNAPITGESIPLIRTANIPQTGSVTQATNMVFFSTNVVEGSRFEATAISRY